ncbi:MAG: PDDEXK nuclease domain-containing protein [Rickettsiaceae bacterium]|nr:PDDEXK nuclease domain-containing protein [Rickettsiaceae bacterium]
MTQIISISNTPLIQDLRLLIDQARQIAVRAVNSEMTKLYWNIGKRIKEEVLKDSRAEYGEQIVLSLSKELSAEYGKGYTRTSLIRMIQFYESFPDIQIGATLSHQLSWSHIIELLPLKDSNQRDFYAYMAITSNWSVRQLRYNIHIMTYERTIASQKTETLLQMPAISREYSKELMEPDILLKDPYILEFLGLKGEFYESDLEEAILREIEKFLIEMGTGFSFVARQKRISIDGDHFYIDLLLYNRKLKRIVAIELKKGKFKAEYMGQMTLYLNYLKEYERYEGEEAPIGIILCTEKSSSQVKLLDLNNSGIHVAEYWTELPPKEIFEKKIQQIILNARNRLENKLIETE